VVVEEEECNSIRTSNGMVKDMFREMRQLGLSII